MAEDLGTSKRMLLYYFGSRDALIAEAIAASRPDISDLFCDVHDTDSLRRAAWARWEAITRGRQQRPIRILFQVLSPAPTQPDRYAELAAETVTAMVEPLVPVFRALGFDDLDARSRASLLISGLRGLCQDRIVTGDAPRIEIAARCSSTPPPRRPRRPSGRADDRPIGGARRRGGTGELDLRNAAGPSSSPSRTTGAARRPRTSPAGQGHRCGARREPPARVGGSAFHHVDGGMSPVDVVFQ